MLEQYLSDEFKQETVEKLSNECVSIICKQIESEMKNENYSQNDKRINENLDLTKILKGCPSGTKFYSSVYGEVTFVRVKNDKYYPIELICYPDSGSSMNAYVTKDGKTWYHYVDGECTLFPSRGQRDWSKFERFWDKPKVEKFDLNTLQPFDKVLARDYTDEPWAIDLYSHKINEAKIIRGVSYCWNYCIPYNEETKHLLGTKDDCPEYYKWWEK